MSELGVSVVMPVFNEKRSIEETIGSLLTQELGEGCGLEILAVDGNSDDGTREILDRLAATDPRVRVVPNPHRTTPFAMNLGLEAARYDFIGILGAHAKYEPRYLRTCLDIVLNSPEMAGCSGRVVTVPGSPGLVGRLCFWVMTSRIGSSGRSFRTLPEGPAETIAYPVFRRHALTDVGGYNTRLTRNQDNDMNTRLADNGWVLYSTWSTSSEYRTPSSLRFMLKYGWRNGRWNAVSLRENRRSMKLRHLAPAAFVGGTVGALLLAILGRRLPGVARIAIACAPVAAHLAAGFSEALPAFRTEKDPVILLGPPTAMLFHLAYGAGTITGIVRPPG